MRVLGIETSCDETAVAVYDADKGIVAEKIYTQLETHRRYGGVVPELASRDHSRKLLPLIDATLTAANLQPKEISGIAYTRGPGLVSALMVGASLAKSLAYAWRVPVLGVHHMEAHLMAALLDDPRPEYPFLALLVSGGHTLLVSVKGLGEYELLGQSLDDAAGEAFDKTAKLLGLPYPGGPAVAALAAEGDPKRFHFPRPMTNRPGLDLSFSGLKTHTMQCFRDSGNDPQTKADIACAFEEAVVDTLVIKCRRALTQTGLDRLVVVGGVSANQRLRATLSKALGADVSVFYPKPQYCTDNGAMVAYTGFLRLSCGEQDDLTIDVKARWPMNGLKTPSSSQSHPSGG